MSLLPISKHAKIVSLDNPNLGWKADLAKMKVVLGEPEVFQFVHPCMAGRSGQSAMFRTALDLNNHLSSELKVVAASREASFAATDYCFDVKPGPCGEGTAVLESMKAPGTYACTDGSTLKMATGDLSDIGFGRSCCWLLQDAKDLSQMIETSSTVNEIQEEAITEEAIDVTKSLDAQNVGETAVSVGEVSKQAVETRVEVAEPEIAKEMRKVELREDAQAAADESTTLESSTKPVEADPFAEINSGASSGGGGALTDEMRQMILDAEGTGGEGDLTSGTSGGLGFDGDAEMYEVAADVSETPFVEEESGMSTTAYIIIGIVVLVVLAALIAFLIKKGVIQKLMRSSK